MAKFAPGPWWSQQDAFEVAICDINGRRIAQLLPDSEHPERAAATERLIRLAPTTLFSLKMAVESLRRSGGHEQLCRHLQRTLDAVEPHDVDPIPASTHKQPSPDAEKPDPLAWALQLWTA